MATNKKGTEDAFKIKAPQATIQKKATEDEDVEGHRINIHAPEATIQKKATEDEDVEGHKISHK